MPSARIDLPPDPATTSGVVVAIPARYASTRLPGKPLRLIAGRPMIEHVYRKAVAAPGVATVVVLTDDERIHDTVIAFGGRAAMTPAACPSGTDRIAWAATSWPSTAIINVQGDEPMIDPAAIGLVAHHLLHHPDDPIVTLAAPATAADLDQPNTVKTVLDRRGYALYFSRAPIPFPRASGEAPMLRHIGLYGYQRETLLRLTELSPSPLERTESLEQLRALENGIRIRVLEVADTAPGVDTEADLAAVEALLSTAADTAIPPHRD